MIKSFLILVTLSLTIFIGNAHADSTVPTTRGHSVKEFRTLIERYRKSCRIKCETPFSNKTAFDIQSPDPLYFPEELRSSLSKVAFIQTQIWGDTILEGDYYSAGQAQLDRVVALFQNETLIGYKITYSERAWFIGDCDFKGNEDALKNCSEGRIHESSFVSPDFRFLFRDDEDFASFAS